MILTFYRVVPQAVNRYSSVSSRGRDERNNTQTYNLSFESCGLNVPQDALVAFLKSVLKSSPALWRLRG